MKLAITSGGLVTLPPARPNVRIRTALSGQIAAVTRDVTW